MRDFGAQVLAATGRETKAQVERQEAEFLRRRSASIRGVGQARARRLRRQQPRILASGSFSRFCIGCVVGQRSSGSLASRAGLFRSLNGSVAATKQRDVRITPFTQQDVRQRTKHVQMKIRIAAAELGACLL